MTQEEAIYYATQSPSTIPGLRLNRLREFIQVSTLRALGKHRFFEQHSLMGGCALKFLYGNNRFSNDLNFTASGKSFRRFSEDLDFEGSASLEKYLSQALKDLKGFPSIDVRINNKTAVHRASLRFPNIKQQAGLSKNPNEMLEIIIEVDTRPPSGAITETSLISSPLSATVQHHDMTTLMAGKIAALCLRPFVKARDWYDWLWYRSNPTGKLIEPNLEYLQERINQTQTPWDATEWKNRIQLKLQSPTFPGDLISNIARFLERPEDASMMTKQNFLAAISLPQNKITGPNFKI
jgi:predicted nucleotidyltransferase component of viral defense system